LSIVLSVAKRHGGKAYVESQGKGKGSAFTIELPLKA
jgi:signal transduction histidine kinase